MRKFGVIFDMDGVIMDNNAYHEIAWRKFCQKYGIQLTDEELHEYVFGRIAKDTLEFIFKRDLSVEAIHRYVEEKEKIYRDVYGPVIKPLDRLLTFLDQLQLKGVPMGMATSAPPGNVEFTFEHIPVARYFRFCLDASAISKGKPDPEIYHKSIDKLGIQSGDCFVFEDSLSGIRAAAGAGARVIGISTTHEPDELSDAETVIPDFTRIRYEDLERMM